MKPFAAVIGLIVGIAAATPASAQDYPNRPIRVLTTTSAGGISDIFMRALGEELRKRWGQPIVVENRPGGMQNVGARACSDAAPDGYTICILNADPIVYNQFLLKNMPFDPEKGVQPITNLLPPDPDAGGECATQRQDHRRADRAVEGEGRHAELPDRCRRRSRSTWRRSRRRRAPTGCAYRSRAAARRSTRCSRGTTPIALIGEGNVIGQIRAGTMTPLVMVNNIRSPNFPNVPTLDGDRLQGRAVAELVRPVHARRHAAADRRPGDEGGRSIVSDPAFRERHLTARSLVPAINTPEQFAEEIKEDRAVAQQVVKDAGLTPQ